MLLSKNLQVVFGKLVRLEFWPEAGHYPVNQVSR